MKPAIISKVTPNSIAAEIGFEPGDAIVAINGTKLRDLIDYQYLGADEYLELEVLDKKGTTHYIEIEKEDGEKIGLIDYKCHAYSHILPGNVTIGHWGHDSRGSNQFLNYTTMVTIGDYTENLGALAAKWQCETGQIVNPTSLYGGYGRYVKRRRVADPRSESSQRANHYLPTREVVIR